MTTFVTTHNVIHNEREYPAGAEITLDEAVAVQAAAITHLRAQGAIALAVELQRAEDIQSRLDAKDAEINELRAEQARIQAELEAAREAAAASVAPAPAPAPKAAKATTAAAATAIDSPPAAS